MKKKKPSEIEVLRAECEQRRQAQDALTAERNMLRAVIDNIPDLVFVKDRDSRFVIANQALAHAFGVDGPQQLIGKSDCDFFPPEKVAHILATEQALMQSGVPLINHEEPNDTLGGVERWFSTTKVAIRDEQGQVAGFVGECREITERKRYEADLARRNAELSALYAKLSETQEQLIESEKLAALGFMVAGIAHELNTPIGNALLATTTLVQQARDFFDTAVSGLTRSMLARYIEDASDVGDIVLRNLQRAAELITNFKQVAAIDGSGAPRAAFLLNNVIAEALLLLAPQVRQTSCVIDQDIAGEIRMNSYPGALQQVLLNLLDNALLHGLAGRTSGRIVITARLESEACLFLSVSDNGHGITADHLRHVFEPFYTTRLGVGGSGLGLNITHSIVTGILGGRITARSEPGSGSSFELLLPIEAPSGPQLPRA